MAKSDVKVTSKVHEKITKAPDLVLAVRTVRVCGIEYVDLRDFTPSDKTLGKGVLFDKRLLPDVLAALGRLNEHLGGNNNRNTAQIPGQLSLF